MKIKKIENLWVAANKLRGAFENDVNLQNKVLMMNR